jgi:hypothetical protein
MSSSSARGDQAFPFAVFVDCADALLTVYDAQFRPVAEDYGELRLTLPPGLYAVRSQLAGQIEEEIVRHVGPGPTRFQAKRPARSSAAPLAGAQTSHEYYLRPCVEWSRKNTARPLGPGTPSDSHLFIFLRARDNAAGKDQDLAAGLSLKDSSGRVVCSFTPAETRSDRDDGWLAFSADAASGTYVLSYVGPVPREMPVHLYPGWSTQLFLFHDGQPRFETLRVFLAPVGAGFTPDDPSANALDVALTGLQYYHGARALPAGNLLVQGEFTNPMVGLVGTYLLLRQEVRERETIRRSLERLAQMLPDSPDVRALELQAARLLGQPLPRTPFERPPMIRAGLEAVIDAAATAPELMPEKGLIDEVADHLYDDSFWSSWEPEVGGDPGWVSAWIKLNLPPQTIRRAIESDPELASRFADVFPPQGVVLKRKDFVKTAGELAELILRYAPGPNKWISSQTKRAFQAEVARAHLQLKFCCILKGKQFFCEELSRLVKDGLLPCLNGGPRTAFHAANAILALAGLYPRRLGPNELPSEDLSAEFVQAAGKKSTDPDELAAFLYANWN